MKLNIDEKHLELAKQLFYNTRNGMGFTSPEWEEIHPESQDMYICKAIKRLEIKK